MSVIYTRCPACKTIFFYDDTKPQTRVCKVDEHAREVSPTIADSDECLTAHLQTHEADYRLQGSGPARELRELRAEAGKR